MLVLGVWWNPIAEASLTDGVQSFRAEPAPTVVKAAPEEKKLPALNPKKKKGKGGEE